MRWLKATAQKIYEMEHDRKICILSGDYDKAYKLLLGIKFARKLFANESKKYAKSRISK